MKDRLNHVGFATMRPEHYVKILGSLGFELYHMSNCEHFNTQCWFMKIPGSDVMIELVKPLNQESPIHKFLETKGEGLHHIAYQIEGVIKDEKIDKSIKGALPNMYIHFSGVDKDNKLLIEWVMFDV